jgi:glyoxylase-like metal-dependent hydrolase (beta-lactamase superfamily II)
MAAERLVRAAAMDTVILRPKAIYGPGDTAILPRLIKAARSGRLRQIGDGHTTTNMTHVRDVAEGIILALTSKNAVGKTYTLTGDEEVKIWDLVTDLAERLGLPAVTGNISVAKANRIAGVLEATWRALSLPGEPPLTRYSVSILGYDKTYDISKAKRDLGYAPRIKMADGLDEVVRCELDEVDTKSKPIRRVRPLTPDTEVGFSLLNAGTMTTRRKYFEISGNMERLQVPALFAVLEHPREGTVLFDTGYTPRFHRGTRHFPHCIYGIVTPVNVTPKETAVRQLASRGISPESVRWIVLSHFDPDHYGGLKDFPNATVVCRADAWTHVAGKEGLAALRAHMLPGHLPDDICGRLQLLPQFEGETLGPFAHSLDLFGDGSIRLIDLPGHAPGHVGAWIRGTDEQHYALVADAVWTADSIAYPDKGLHRLLAHSTREREATVRLLQKLKASHPNVAIIPSHCPATARAFETGFAETTLP